MMTTETAHEIVIEGPQCRCATEYGYGDYYRAVEVMRDTDDRIVARLELAYICIERHGTPTRTQLRNLRLRALRIARRH